MSKRPPDSWDFDAVLAPLPDVRGFGRMIFDPVWAERTHPASAGHEILHVIEGRMELVMGDRRYRVGPGDTALVPAGAMHRDEFDTAKGLDILYCSFTWPLADAYFKRVDNDTLAAMSSDRRTQLVAMFDQLRADPPGESAASRALLRVRLLAILLFILRQQDDEPSPETESASRRLMLRAKEYVHAHYAECVGLNDIAEALRVSPYHLSHVFSQESDFSLFAYLMQVRMSKAKELLRVRRLNVSEVSRAVGYQDPNYFAKVFRKHVGKSPSAFAAARRSG
ncbi:MAG: AraC family transcriptional regulator [Planctomycetes bacterium]|nr:AraC family transcriptional regulator [Planctomycetota bacterium]